MMAEIKDFPGVPEGIYQYQSSFDYAVWTPDTEITLCRVPWDSSYRDIVQFDSAAARDDYLTRNATNTVTLSGYVYLRFGEPVRVNIPFSQCSHCNYLLVRNRVQPVYSPTNGIPRIPDEFCYFVTQVNYVAPNTTELVLQLDVWQTYGDRMKLGWSYLSRGHAGISNPNSTLDNPQDYLLEPEGLNMGDEYEVVHQEWLSFQSDESIEKDEPQAFWIVLMSSANIAGSVTAGSTPTLKTSYGTVVQSVPESCDVWFMDINNYRKLVDRLSDYPWVTQCFQMVSAIPYDFVVPESDYNGSTIFNNIQYFQGGRMVPSGRLRQFATIANFRNRIMQSIESKYSHLFKFATSPFSIIELTTFTGGTIIMKPECVDSNDLTLHGYICAAPPSFRLMFTPGDYNGKGDQEVAFYDYGLRYGEIGANKTASTLYGGENFDMSLVYDAFPQFSVVNNQYLNYIASNRNRINYSYSAADWARDRAFLSAETSRKGVTLENQYENLRNFNQLGYLMGNYAIDMNSAFLERSNALASAETTHANNWDSAAWGNVANALTGSSGSTGVLTGAAGGAINVAVGMNNVNRTYETSQQNINRTYNTTTANSLASMGNQWNLANANTQAGIAYRTALGDMNLDLAKQVANGDYDLAIQQIQATVQDAQMLQPTVTGQQGGEFFNMANGITGIMVKFKVPKPHFIKQIGDFWLRFGYYVNRWVMPPKDLRLMGKFTYWKFTYAGVQGDMPYLFMNTIKGIMEAGTTVWRNPDDMFITPLEDNSIVSSWGY